MFTLRKSQSISVVVPAFNEAERIGQTLDRIAGYLEARAVPFEILVVDDGSTDQTATIVEAHPAVGVHLLRLPENRGKGAATRTGVMASTHELVLLCDADLSTPIEELDRLAAWVEEVPIVIASRQVEGANVARTARRRFASKVFSSTLRSLGLCRGLLDTQCGFKLIRGEVARSLFALIEIDGFAFDIELLELARHYGLNVREVGVTWQESGSSTVSLLRHAPHMVLDSFAILGRIRRLSLSTRSLSERSLQELSR